MYEHEKEGLAGFHAWPLAGSSLRLWPWKEKAAGGAFCQRSYSDLVEEGFPSSHVSEALALVCLNVLLL